MQPYTEVTFVHMSRDASVEAAVHRWVGRLEAEGILIRGVFIAIDQGGRQCKVCLKLELVDGSASTAITARADIYVAVADAFRGARRQLLERMAASRDVELALVSAG